MEIFLKITEEETRRALTKTIRNEVSKHGYPGNLEGKILVSLGGKDFPLEDLNLALSTVIEVNSGR